MDDQIMISPDEIKKKSRSVRFIELDSLRGIAIALVMLSHYTWAYDFHFGTLGEHFFSFPYGDFGVQIFFMISGFVIFMTLDHTKNLTQFVISRFARLYPTYWICILITVIVISFFPVPTLGNYSILQFLANLTMIQGYLQIAHIDQVYWSLGVELMFYVLMGIVFYLKKLNKIEVISLFWLALVVLKLIFDFPFEKYFKVLLILESAPLFIAGMMFYKIKFKESSLLNHIIIIISLVIFFFNMHFQLLERSNQVDEGILNYILIIFAFILFYLMIYFDIKILKNKYLLFLGYISYPLYLLHNVIGYAIIYRVKQLSNNQFFYVLPTMFVAIILAYIVTKIMEKPTKKIKTKLLSLQG